MTVVNGDAESRTAESNLKSSEEIIDLSVQNEINSAGRYYSDSSMNDSDALIKQKRFSKFDSFVLFMKRLSRFIGPGYMIAVGYLDPGNWATDLEAGSTFGYSHLFIILLSSIIAMYLQYLSLRLGIVSGLDLAEATGVYSRKYLRYFLWILAEVSIIACDLAEVIGTAIALKLIFKIPIIYGVLITSLDVLLILAGLDKKRLRLFEIIMMVLVGIVGICFIVQVAMVKPVGADVMYGFLPQSHIFTDTEALFLVLGIIGATVMPHNLYLHSSISKTRRDIGSIKSNILYSTIDSCIALVLAMSVNCSILIVSAASFYGTEKVADISVAAELLSKVVGEAASVLFGLSLLLSGQSATLTGTLAGQIIFEGFLQMKMKPWLRRILTRVTAIAPTLIIILVAGENSLDKLLIYSQVVLSLQLPFAVIPLVYYVSDPVLMGPTGRIGLINKIISWIIALFLVGINILFIVRFIMGE